MVYKTFGGAVILFLFDPTFKNKLSIVQENFSKSKDYFLGY